MKLFYSLYKCFRDKYIQHRNDISEDERDCKAAQFIEMCVKEVRETCIGFFQRQLKIFVQGHYVDQGETIPQCMKSLLAEKTEEKFPIFNKFVDDLTKLVDELAMIKKVLNNQ